MKVLSEKKTTLFLFLAVVILGSVVAILYYTNHKVKTISDSVEHTENVLRKSDNVLLDIVNVETVSRGYVLTEDPSFLGHFKQDLSTLNSNLEILRTLTRDNPKQQVRIESLKKWANERVGLLTEMIKESKKNGLNDEEKIALVGKGGFITDIIRTKIDEINSEEFSLLKQRKSETENGNAVSEWIFAILIISISISCVLTAIIIKNHRLHNKELIEAKNKAEESNRLKEAFLSNMSHEIRTPMNAIMGFSDILFKSQLGEKERGFVKIIKSEGENLLTIINDILDISKIEAGMMTFEEHPFSVKELFKSLQILLESKIMEKDIQLSFSCDKEVPDKLLGDNTRLTQIIINLTGNAIKFTQKGNITVRAQLLKQEQGGTLVEFLIKDTGIGIAPDKIKLIFERFRQAESNTTRKYGGTGLGLSIAKQLVELQGGNLAVKSELNVGSEFSFSIFYKQVAQSDKINEKTAVKFNLEELIKLKTLLVEDNQTNVRLISSLFSMKTMQLQVAENGRIAIDMLRENSFDLILMDMEMPVMNGYDATKSIRTDLNNKIPIIAMTAHAMAGERERCLCLGMNEYISKPINSDLLFEKMYAVTHHS